MLTVSERRIHSWHGENIAILIDKALDTWQRETWLVDRKEIR